MKKTEKENLKEIIDLCIKELKKTMMELTFLGASL